MLKFIERFLGGSRTERETKKLDPVVDLINKEYAKLQSLSDDELRGMTDQFKSRIHEALSDIEADIEEVKSQLEGAVTDPSGDGAPVEELTLEKRLDLYRELDNLEEEWHTSLEKVLDELLPEAFAVAKEACRRMVGKSWVAGGSEITWEMVPFDVQLIGGIVLHQGRIAEMKTGEGKTLVAVAPVYLNALAGRGVHLVTVNPYLAQRDAEWMGPVFEFLGMRVDCIDKYDPHSEGRKSAYEADVTYGTNNEFGFDYLRDNSFVIDPNQLMQRHHHFSIVDEIDSVLIDEARTPLIISGPVPQADTGRFEELKPLVERLVNVQKKLVASLVREAQDFYSAGKNDEAGLALLRAQRGNPKNKQLIKLLAEPGVSQLLQKTEYFYLQDNAKNMPFVDDELYYAIDEKQQSIELSEKGLKYCSGVAGEDELFFIIPDVGTELVKLEEKYETLQQEKTVEIETNEELSEEKRANKISYEMQVLHNQREEDERNLYTLISERADRIHALNQLLRAYTYYERDVEYIIQDGKILIVDEQTGRVLSGRRYSEGLHQAIEAKESVKVQSATQTYATITLQNYFRMYRKLAGMTGTAETEAAEFFEIYKLDVSVIPTNKPVIREDLEDLVYRSRREKYMAVIEKIAEYQDRGQPVLVGTTSVEVSETLSRMLDRRKIKHNVLNAKPERAKQEAVIVKEAGKRGAVTLATNMAGRGTDIKLGEGVIEAGGLAIIGTERHESRRIDLQLRGRSGRQGDPGESVFYVSLEDDLMRLFGHDRTAKIMDRLGLEEGEVITHPWVTKSIERAQKKVEQNNFTIRKRQLEYDDVLNNQRVVIYDRRMHALKGERLRGDILNRLQEFIDSLVEAYYPDGELDAIRDELLRSIAYDLKMEKKEFLDLGEKGLADKLFDDIVDRYNRKRNQIAESLALGVQRMMDNLEQEEKPERISIDFTDGRRVYRLPVNIQKVIDSKGQEVNDALERTAMLLTIDAQWTDHLRELDELKEGIGLRAFGQKDPVVEYKMEAFNLFKTMLDEISQEVLGIVFKAGPFVGNAPKKTAPSGRARMDRTRAQASHASNQGYGVKSGGDGASAETGARRDPTVKSKPAVAEKTYGRNQIVKIQNPATGETQTIKYKVAQKKIEQGWIIMS